VHQRKAGPGHRILQERDRRCRLQAMPAAQVQKSADKAVTAVSVVITAARPVAVVGKKLEYQIEQPHRFCDFRFGHWFDRSDPGHELTVSRASAICIAHSCDVDRELNRRRSVRAAASTLPGADRTDRSDAMRLPPQ
jgi:hypothetical protein